MFSPLLFYKCLSEETRLKSLLLITVKNELCVCDLIQALKLSQPKISRHLADLRKCKILIDERRGLWVYYKLHPALPDWAKHVLNTTVNEEPSFVAEELANLNASSATCS